MFINVLILIVHSAVLSLASLFALHLGKEVLRIWLVLLALGMNLFVLKQITLFGLHVTCSDTLAVAYLLGLNLIQEFFGRSEVLKTVLITLCASAAFLGLSLISLLYIPSPHDTAHPLLMQLFFPQLRLLLASTFTLLCVQLCDLSLFAYLRRKTAGRWFALRVTGSLYCAITLDTLLFSFLGLYGLVPSMLHIIFFSLITKGTAVLFSVPYLTFARNALPILKFKPSQAQ